MTARESIAKVLRSFLIVVVSTSRRGARCGNSDGRGPYETAGYAEVVPPELVLRRGDSFGPIFKPAKGCPPVSCAVVHPCDRDSLLGPIEAAKRG